MLANGDKNGAYGYVAQLFDGTEVTEVGRLAEESFKVNMKHLVRKSPRYSQVPRLTHWLVGSRCRKAICTSLSSLPVTQLLPVRSL